MKRRVRFKYYWPGAGENGEALAFYSLPIGNGYSDVTADTLREKGLKVPETPSFIYWSLAIEGKQKCGQCFASVKGATDLQHHIEMNHQNIKGELS